MNRRAMIQSLGLAPLALLAKPKDALALDVNGGIDLAIKEPVNNPEWDTPKMFTISTRVEPGDLDNLARTTGMTLSTPSLADNFARPLFKKLHRVIRHTTKTPAIEHPARLYFFDREGSPQTWHVHQAVPMTESMTRYHPLEVDVAEFFRNPNMLPILVAHQAVNTTMLSVHNFTGPNRDEAFLDALQEKLDTLGEINIDFMYYGPAPYPLNGKVHVFDHETSTWKAA